MKSFREFINTNLDEAKFDFYRTNEGKLTTSGNYPIWLSHTLEQARGYISSDRSHRVKPSIYGVKVRGKIAHYKDSKIQKLFDDEGIDSFEYQMMLVSNPSNDEVLKDPATVLLESKGFVGYTHSDYDSTDHQKDHDTTVIFRKNNLSSVTLIE